MMKPFIKYHYAMGELLVIVSDTLHLTIPHGRTFIFMSALHSRPA